jgi:hypothetical protein
LISLLLLFLPDAIKSLLVFLNPRAAQKLGTRMHMTHNAVETRLDFSHQHHLVTSVKRFRF